MSEEARTGKRFPLALAHQDPPGRIQRRCQGSYGGSQRRRRLHSRRCLVGRRLASGIRNHTVARHDGRDENVKIQCKGRVVRADETGEGGEGRGVACVIDSYEFVRNS